MTKKNIILSCSPFTASLTKVMKSSSRVMCSYDEENKSAYVCNGFMLVKLTMGEYDVLIRPVTGRDPGSYIVDRGSVAASTTDLPSILANAVKESDSELSAMPCAFDVSGHKEKLVPYYSAQGDFVTAFNSDYVGILSNNITCAKAKSKASGMVCFNQNDPVALILPVRMDGYQSIERAARAWFGSEATPQHGSVGRMADELAKAQRDLSAANEDNENLRGACDRYAASITALKTELEKAKNELEYAQDSRQAAMDVARSTDEELTAAQNEITELKTSLAAAQDEIAELKAALAAAQAKPSEPEPKSETQPVPTSNAAAGLLDRLNALDGVTATVKGTQTAAPVVWRSGDVDAHTSEIMAMGGKWSNKRGAWYFKAA